MTRIPFVQSPFLYPGEVAKTRTRCQLYRPPRVIKRRYTFVRSTDHACMNLASQRSEATRAPKPAHVIKSLTCLRSLKRCSLRNGRIDGRPSLLRWQATSDLCNTTGISTSISRGTCSSNFNTTQGRPAAASDDDCCRCGTQKVKGPATFRSMEHWRCRQEAYRYQDHSHTRSRPHHYRPGKDVIVVRHKCIDHVPGTPYTSPFAGL